MIPPYSAKLVSNLVGTASKDGVPERGAALFAAAKSACISCHKVGKHGGTVGPELTTIGKQRLPKQIVESSFWPKREVKPEYVFVSVLTVNGKVHRGYKVKSTDQAITLRDRTTGEFIEIARDDIHEKAVASTLIPDELMAAMSPSQQRDLIAFLIGLGRGDAAVFAKMMESVMAHAHVHAPAKFSFDRRPLRPEDWPNSEQPINQNRLVSRQQKLDTERHDG